MYSYFHNYKSNPSSKNLIYSLYLSLLFPQSINISMSTSYCLLDGGKATNLGQPVEKEKFVLDLETKAGTRQHRHKTMTTPDRGFPTNDDVTKKARTRRKEERTKQKLKLKQGHKKKRRKLPRPHPHTSPIARDATTPRRRRSKWGSANSRQLWARTKNKKERLGRPGAARSGLISKTQTTMMTMENGNEVHNQQERKIRSGCELYSFSFRFSVSGKLCRHPSVSIYVCAALVWVSIFWMCVCVCKDDSLLFLISLQREMNEEPRGKRENLKERENETKDTATESLSAKFPAHWRPPAPSPPPLLAKLAATAARH